MEVTTLDLHWSEHCRKRPGGFDARADGRPEGQACACGCGQVWMREAGYGWQLRRAKSVTECGTLLLWHAVQDEADVARYC